VIVSLCPLLAFAAPEGLFEEFGLSNFSAWQVAQAWEIAARHRWIRRSVYQGMYNAITRAVEPELFKCLGNYGIRFHAYNPLAGGAAIDGYVRELPL
jgi:aflatoxin B1 aldehyde reductase